MFIKNYQSLASSNQRKVVLDLVETGFKTIQFKPSVEGKVRLDGQTLHITDKQYDLSKVQRLYVVGLGKGSAEVCHLLEGIVGDRLTAGWDIDVVEPPDFKTIQYTKGNHPVPSQVNLEFTKNVLDHLQQLTESDLVLLVICGGGSALFEYPQHLQLDGIAKVNEALVKSGAAIGEMNIVRKHLSAVKGGKLAKHLYPAQVSCLIFSDVPGNDLATIASGPTVLNTTSMDDVRQVLAKYHLDTSLNISEGAFSETPTDAKYFAKVDNLLVVSNDSALEAMKAQAEALGYTAVIHSDHIEGDARTLGPELVKLAKPGQITLVGGESTIHVTHAEGKGGRNQALTLAALLQLPEDTIICSFDSDGWDFYGLAGAIGDEQTLKKAHHLGVNPQDFLDQDNSYAFWQAVGDGIDTGKLDSNVADLIVIYRP